MPDFGSRRPSAFTIWPVHQIDPSRVASGSCGRDPGVGTGHDVIDTVPGPGTTAPAGLAFSGKLFVKYAVIVAS